MITKKELLKNVRNYSPQEIADAIKAGVVSLYELSKETEGAFTPLLKRQVKNILDTPISSSQGDLIESQPSEVVTSSNSIDSPSIPVIVSSESAPKQVIPVISLSEPAANGVDLEGAGPQQPPDSNPTIEDRTAMFRHIFSFNGRIRRMEYGLTYLAYCIWNFPMQVMSLDEISETYAIIYLVTLLPILWILFAQGAKRCHDRGNSGWYQIIPFYILWMIFAEGESEINKYGEIPK